MTALPQMSKLFDLLVLDAEGAPFIAVEVTGTPGQAADVGRWLKAQASPHAIRYGLVVDPESVRLFDLEPADPASILVLPTQELLDAYAHSLDTEKATERYLVLLVDTWLRNIMQPPAGPLPPAMDQLTQAGIAARLRDGQT